MKREVDIKDIWDGKLYGVNDMVKVECNDCEGCFACCHNMGASIILDPLDVFHMTTNLHNTFEQLLKDKIELNIIEGVILPNLKMSGEKEVCSFLNANGRCTIHGFRPGICRIFPLGRYYEYGKFQYFLQVNECKKDHRTKVKVKKWIDMPDIKRNEKFILAWHDLVEEIQVKSMESENETDIKMLNMHLLKLFFMKPYDEKRDFYDQFEERLQVKI